MGRVIKIAAADYQSWKECMEVFITAKSAEGISDRTIEDYRWYVAKLYSTVGGDRRAVGVNKNQPIVRQRFSIAHEIAHYVKKHTSTADISITAGDWF